MDNMVATALGHLAAQPQTRHVMILGPTASGKTGLAIDLAQRWQAQDGINTHIINMDSMAVYRQIPILAAAPTLEEQGGLPHHLFGHISAAARYSVGTYLNDVRDVLEKIGADRAIFVGGTGLYAQGLTHGLVDVPDVPDEVAAIWREKFNADKETTYQELLKIDPASKIKPYDGVRIARALSVYHHTGTSLADWQTRPQAALLDNVSVLKIRLETPRAALYERINQRFLSMLEQGALEEARTMAALNLEPSLPAMRAIGVPWLITYLAGELSMGKAIELSQIDSRQLAKRQMTWVRNRCADYLAITPDWAADLPLAGSPLED